MQILEWIIFNWIWVALFWLVIGIVTTHLIIRTQEEPIRVYPDGYVRDFGDSGFMYKWLIPLGNKVLVIAPFYVIVALLMVIVWPATLLLLLLLTYVAHGK